MEFLLHYPTRDLLEGETKPLYSRESLSSLLPKQPEHRKNPNPVVTTPDNMLSRHVITKNSQICILISLTVVVA